LPIIIKEIKKTLGGSMRKKILFSICMLMALTLLVNAAPKEKQVLPASLTDTEKEFIQNNYDQYINSKTTRNAERLPQGNFWGPAEFEPADEVIFSWNGYSTFLKQLIKFTADGGKAWVVADNGWYNTVDSVKRELEDYGVNTDNVRMIEYGLNSVWMRDFGPWFIYTEDGDREIIDFKYNRPRPLDDRFPEKVAELLEIQNNQTNLIMPGGNFILDGHDVAILTDVVFNPAQGGMPNLSVDELKDYLKKLFNVKKVILLEQMKRDGTGHVDMFCKLLNDTTFIVGEYATPSDGADDNYYILNRNAEKLAHETNGNGEPFKVVRIPMPKYDGTSYSYTNSLIYNKKVLVPIYGFSTDEEALNIYRQILPGYDVRGFDARNIITANGAIHCITKMVMADPLKIEAAPITETRAGQETTINFKVDSTREREYNKVAVYYSDNPEGPFAEVMANETEDGYAANIPSMRAGTTVYYFIQAESDNMYETFPEDAPERGISTFVVR